MRTTDVILRHRKLALDLFVCFNLACLILDVFVAHSVNSFAHPAEWIPVYFSAIATLLLIGGLTYGGVEARGRWIRSIPIVVGWGALAVGIGGMIYHLEAHFFQEATLHNLTYSAPFVAPLAFAGLGFLLLLNRMVEPSSLEWGLWIVFFAWGGFVGNLGLSLLDHAQNGFYYPAEWISVASAALAVGFLCVVLAGYRTRLLLFACLGVLGLQVIVGVLGFALHLGGTFASSVPDLWRKIIYGPPIFAPLLFPNIALLGAFGIWDVYQKTAGE